MRQPLDFFLYYFTISKFMSKKSGPQLSLNSYTRFIVVTDANTIRISCMAPRTQHERTKRGSIGIVTTTVIAPVVPTTADLSKPLLLRDMTKRWLLLVPVPVSVRVRVPSSPTV